MKIKPFRLLPASILLLLLALQTSAAPSFPLTASSVSARATNILKSPAQALPAPAKILEGPSHPDYAASPPPSRPSTEPPLLVIILVLALMHSPRACLILIPAILSTRVSAYTELVKILPCEHQCYSHDVAEANGSYYMSGMHRYYIGYPDIYQKYSVSRLDSAGNVVWTWDYTCYYSHLYVYGVTVTGDGWILLTGFRIKGCTGDRYVVFVAKIDRQGNAAWTKEYDWTYFFIEGTRIAELSNGNYALPVWPFFLILNRDGSTKCSKYAPDISFQGMAEIAGYLYVVGSTTSYKCAVAKHDISTCERPGEDFAPKGALLYWQC